MHVVVGDLSRSKLEGTEQIIKIKGTSVHHDYRKLNPFDNDFAILKLATPVKFSNNINPICLPSSSDTNFDSVDATASRWGSLKKADSAPLSKHPGPYPDILQKVIKLFFSRKSNSAITYICLSVGPSGSKTPQRPSSIILHSSTFIIHNRQALVQGISRITLKVSNLKVSLKSPRDLDVELEAMIAMPHSNQQTSLSRTTLKYPHVELTSHLTNIPNPEYVRLPLNP